MNSNQNPVCKADERYQYLKSKVNEKMKLINAILKNFDKDQKKHNRDYGFAGSMSYIEETLDNIIEGFEETQYMPKNTKENKAV
ncbi:MAG: hypothetical protein K1X86_16785 [Ignavibacteria bacterium]|nr:hypothetical protein [Ignavibacteria bacterium]